LRAGRQRFRVPHSSVLADRVSKSSNTLQRPAARNGPWEPARAGERGGREDVREGVGRQRESVPARSRVRVGAASKENTSGG